jgi:hypothetical protein
VSAVPFAVKAKGIGGHHLALYWAYRTEIGPNAQAMCIGRYTLSVISVDAAHLGCMRLANS